MKLSIISTLKCAAQIGTAALLFGCQAETTISQEIQPVQPVLTNSLTNKADESSVTSAPAVPPPTAAPKISEGIQGIVNLAERGVGDEVLQAYIENAPTPFNLTAEEILYLSDLGISETVITAMIKHQSPAKAVAQTNAVAITRPPETPGAAVSPGAPVQAPGPAPSVSIAATPEFDATGQTPAVVYQTQAAPVEYNYFYNTLSPYGSWVEVADYGLCWRPTVAVVSPGWRPYSDRGRWIYSDWGWYWQSDYSWGWAPFHYGRWHRHPRHGWLWTPDHVWGPAWVTWRYSDAYCGWAPLPPETFYDVGFGLRYRGGHVGISFDFGLGSDCYTFIPTHRFHDRSPWRHTLSPTRVAGVYRNTTIINNYVQNNKTIVNEGISRERIAAITQSEIRKVTVRDLPSANGGRPVTIKPDRIEKNGSELVVYRPQVPRSINSLPSSKQQQELRKPSVGNATGASPDPATGGRVAAPGVPIKSRTLSATASSTKPAAQLNSANNFPDVKASSALATIPSTRLLNEASVKPDKISPPLYRSYSTPPEARASENTTAQPAKPAAENRGVVSRGGSWPLVTPNAKANPITATPSQAGKSANESRGSFRADPQLIRTPVRPGPYSEQPRPIATVPSGSLDQLGTASARSAGSSVNISTPTYQLPQRPSSFMTVPSTIQQPPVNTVAPTGRANSGLSYRQEMDKPAFGSAPDRRTFEQPVPSYQPQPFSSGAGRSTVSAPSVSSPSAPQYSPPARYSPPSSPSITTVPSAPRYSSPPAAIPSHQVSPSSASPAPRPSAPSAPSSSSQSSSSSGSSRRNESK